MNEAKYQMEWTEEEQSDRKWEKGQMGGEAKIALPNRVIFTAVCWIENGF